MSMDLDPKVVLQHLHELGYRNITPPQLDEFIRDLKKLIRYEMAKKKTGAGSEDSSSTLPNTTDDSPSPPPPPHHTPIGSHDKQSGDASSSSSESSIQQTRKVLRECTKLGSHRSRERDQLSREKAQESYRPPLKPAKSCDCLWRRIGGKCCEENFSKEKQFMKNAKSKENLAPPRPKSSFIRTWQMSGQPRPGSASQRCDPVALYHQYQQLWKQQKLPGENSHNDLRWSIRERMLGQEPHPRSCSCDCKCCPCKLEDTDFSGDPKKVSSKILPRGPFCVDGRIYGPLGVGNNGEFVAKDRHLTGIFELDKLDFETEHSPTKVSPERSKNKFNNKPSVGAWLSKDEVEKANHVFENGARRVKQTKTATTNDAQRIADGELKNSNDTHDKSTCRYCGLIHYVLNSKKPENSQTTKISYWPQQFTAPRKGNFQNVQPSKEQRPQSPSLTSKSLSTKSQRDVEHSLNLAQPNASEKQSEQKRSSDNYMKATIPIRLKGFHGSVRTEAEVSKGKQLPVNISSSDTLLVIATQVKIKKC